MFFVGFSKSHSSLLVFGLCFRIVYCVLCGIALVACCCVIAVIAIVDCWRHEVEKNVIHAMACDNKSAIV